MVWRHFGIALRTPGDPLGFGSCVKGSQDMSVIRPALEAGLAGSGFENWIGRNTTHMQKTQVQHYMIPQALLGATPKYSDGSTPESYWGQLPNQKLSHRLKVRLD